jgi:hypothetical protein
MIETTVNACCAGIGGGVPIPSGTEIMAAIVALVGGWSAVTLLCFWYFLGRRQ